jgi:hypothetical protein
VSDIYPRVMAFNTAMETELRLFDSVCGKIAFPSAAIQTFHGFMTPMIMRKPGNRRR